MLSGLPSHLPRSGTRVHGGAAYLNSLLEGPAQVSRLRRWGQHSPSQKQHLAYEQLEHFFQSPPSVWHFLFPVAPLLSNEI